MMIGTSDRRQRTNNRLLVLLAQLMTPRDHRLRPDEQRRARFFLSGSLGLLLAGIAAFSITDRLNLTLNLIVCLTVYALLLLYARFISFRTGKILVVVGTPLVTTLMALAVHTEYAYMLLVVVSLNAFILGNFVLPLRLLRWVGLGLMIGLLLVLMSDRSDRFLIHLILSGLACTLGGVVLLYRRMMASRQALPLADQRRLWWLETFEPLLVTVSYSTTVTKTEQPQLEILYGPVEAILGSSADQCLAQGGWEQWVAPSDLHLYHQHRAQTLAKESHSADYRIAQPDQPVRWIRDQAHIVIRGTETLICGTVSNITDQVTTENALRSHILQQAVVADLGMRALAFKTVNQLAEHATELTQQVLSISASEIFSYRPATREMHLIAASGDDVRTEKVLSLDDAGLPFQQIFAAQDMLILNNLDQRPAYHQYEFFQRSHIRHCIMNPLYIDDQPFGVMCIYTTGAPFDDEEVYFLQSVGNILTNFVTNQQARAHEIEQHEISDALRAGITMLVTELDLQTILDSTLESLEAIIHNHDASSLMLATSSDDMMTAVSQRGYDSQLEQLTMLKFRPSVTYKKYEILLRDGYIVIPDVTVDESWTPLADFEWIRSYLGAPIIIDGKFVGLINLDSRQPNAFTSQQGLVLKAFADKVALAIRNAQRATDLERLVSERTDALQAERQQLQAILDATGEGIYYTEQGMIRYANQALFDLTGYERAELIGQAASVLHPVAAETDATAHPVNLLAAADDQIRRSESLIRRRDGSTVQAAMTTSALGENARLSSVIRSVTVVRDISLQKEFEQQQRRFISNAAHELRTPITTLNTRMYLMEKKPDSMDEHVAILRRIVSRMNRLVSDMLDLAYIEYGQMAIQKQSIVLQELLYETVLLLQPEAEESQITLLLQVADQPTSLLADAHRLQQVFTNLIVNAIHYTPEGGHITVNQRVQDTETVVDIIDTGVGIPLENQVSIFEPFFRVETKQTGTGLGLAISQDIVKLHNGHLSVTSELGRGSTFTTRLPLDG